MKLLKNIIIKLKNLPKNPGVYQFFDASGKLLYVGKAKNLKNRVRTYFARSSARAFGRMTGRIQKMVSQITDLKYTITNSEIESLVLENNFIKELKPKYNIDLKDDKNYLFIKINYSHEIPTIETERKITDKHSTYFGPYTSAQNVKQTLRLMRKIFPYCGSKKITSNPCFYYHLGKCPGVCIGKISTAEYQQTLDKISAFLRGQYSKLVKSLEIQMKNFAKKQKFEKARLLRDQIRSLEKTWMHQTVIFPKKVSWDIFSIYQISGTACVNLFIVREGKLIRKENFVLNNTSDTGSEEILSTFLARYYYDTNSIPNEIILPYNILDQLYNRIVKEKFNKTVKTIIPQKGQKATLIALGKANAEEYLKSTIDNKALEDAKTYTSLKQLQNILNLPELPARIECYDISNISGTSATGSMVVFNFGRPDKSQYRKFRIKTKSTPDDYAMMQEVLKRRFFHSVIPAKAGIHNQEIGSRIESGMTRETWLLPNLIIIDGGKGQLNAALAALRISNLKFRISNKIQIIGLAKKLEEIFIPNRKKPLTLPVNSQALFLLQRIRDEAHRFALKYHRLLRMKKMFT
jgi:excinuclease ABC subunit C